MRLFLSYIALTATIALIVALVNTPPKKAQAAVGDISVTNLIGPLSNNRIGRTLNQYEYRVEINNAGEPLDNVRGTVISVNPVTTVDEGDVVFGNIKSGQTVSKDTFTFTHNRAFLFNPANLSWVFTGDVP